MSFEVWVQWFDGERQATLPLATIEALFATSVSRRDGPWWQLRHGELECCELHVKVSPADQVSCVTISRPCGASALWDCVFALLRAGNGVCYWPGSPPVVADEAAARHLPADMREALGAPVFVENGATIARTPESS